MRAKSPNRRVTLSIGVRLKSGRRQFTAPAKSDDLKVANRELGTIQSIADDGRIQLKTDQGSRSVSCDPKQHPHLYHGYAVASNTSQDRPPTGCSSK